MGFGGRAVEEMSLDELLESGEAPLVFQAEAVAGRPQRSHEHKDATSWFEGPRQGDSQKAR